MYLTRYIQYHIYIYIYILYIYIYIYAFSFVMVRGKYPLMWKLCVSFQDNKQPSDTIHIYLKKHEVIYMSCLTVTYFSSFYYEVYAVTFFSSVYYEDNEI